MTRMVNLSSLTRRELKNMLLTEHGAPTRILDTLRTETEPTGKIRREVERIIEEVVDRRPFAVDHVRAAGPDDTRIRSSRSAGR